MVCDVVKDFIANKALWGEEYRNHLVDIKTVGKAKKESMSFKKQLILAIAIKLDGIGMSHI